MELSRYLLLEARRAVVSLPFVAGVCITLLAGLSGAIPETRFAGEAGSHYVFLFFMEGLPWLAPLVATLPFARSYAAERNSGFSLSVLRRLPVSSYAGVKCLTNAVAGGLVLAVPVAAAAIWARTAYAEIPDPNGDPRFLGAHLTLSPSLYMCACVGLAFAFGATFATVGLAASVLFRRPFAAHVSPLVLLTVPAFFLPYAELAFLEPSVMLIPGSNTRASVASLAAQYTFFAVGSVVVIRAFFRLREE